MIVHSRYECGKCGSYYDTEEEALHCEKLDSLCPCQLNTKDRRNPAISFGFTGGEYSVAVYFNWQNKELVAIKDFDGYYRASHTKTEIAIRFCPFCGRKL